MNASGLCKCGCGATTKIATMNNTKQGWVKGEPIDHIRGHKSRNTKFFSMEDRTKRCATCLVWKSFDDFSRVQKRSSSGKHGRQANCSTCSVVVCQKWAEKNPGRRKEINQESIARDPERHARVRKTRGARPDVRASKNAMQKRYREANPDKIRLWNRLRRISQSAAGKVGVAEVRFLMEKQKGRCAICEVRLAKYHIDHIQPLSKGGDNARQNLQLLCPPCNLSKSDRLPIKHMQSIGRLL